MKFEPGRVRMLNCPPLNPPRDTSYGEVTSELVTAASRGRLLPPNWLPLSVVLFWSAPSPRTEKPDGSPSAPGTRVTPGSDAAIAARSPCSAALSTDGLIARSVPLTSLLASVRATRSRGARMRIASSSVVLESLASARRMSWSAVRLTSNRLRA